MWKETLNLRWRHFCVVFASLSNDLKYGGNTSELWEAVPRLREELSFLVNRRKRQKTGVGGGINRLLVDCRGFDGLECWASKTWCFGPLELRYLAGWPDLSFFHLCLPDPGNRLTGERVRCLKECLNSSEAFGTSWTVHENQRERRERRSVPLKSASRTIELL